MDLLRSKARKENAKNRFELGGRMGARTTAVLQAMTTQLVEARGGEHNAATALWKLGLTLERTQNRAEADALNTASCTEEHIGVR